jgi:streptomycin 3"-adenylyltransferase
MLSDPDKQQLDRALALVRQVLDAGMVGAYLFGSAVQGGLRPESDLDIFVVCKRPTTLYEKERLVRGLMAISGKSTPEGTWRRVEVTTVVQSDITPWRYPPSLDFQYGDWLRTEFEKGNFGPSPTPLRPDLALLITMVVAADTALVGPPPGSVFEPVPQEDVLRAMASDIDRLRGDIDSDTRNVILTLARMWSTFATGPIRSKDAAANWVLERLPVAHHPVLVRAREAYLGSEAERWDDLSGALAPCVDYMIAEIKRLAATSSLRA